MTFSPQQPYAPVWAPPPAPANLTVAEPENHDFIRLWRERKVTWWYALLALLAVIVSWALLTVVCTAVAAVVDPNFARKIIADPAVVTPSLFTANNVSLALLIPLTIFFSWLCTRLAPLTAVNVFGRIRWRWAGRVVLIVAPMIVGYTLFQLYIGGVDGVSKRPWTIFMIVVIVLTTPLQSAGEEFLCRSLLPRTFASWIPHREAGLCVAWIVSSGVFVLIHLATDPWLNLFYTIFATCTFVLAWQTKGLEAPIILHAVNNLCAEWSLPFSDFSGMMDRSVGTGSPWMLIDMGWMVLVTALVTWSYRKANPATTLEVR
ncbi:MAG: lysostaphin resistance A-like protein, partial [Propionibacteriaceae bacterium]